MIVCWPTERFDFVKVVPVPIWPSLSLDHTSDAPLSGPSSVSLPDPVKVTLVPCTKLALFVGAEIAAVGGWFGAVIVIITVAVPVAPFESVAVSVIVCWPRERFDFVKV